MFLNLHKNMYLNTLAQRRADIMANNECKLFISCNFLATFMKWDRHSALDFAVNSFKISCIVQKVIYKIITISYIM